MWNVSKKKKKRKHARLVVSNQNKDPLSCHSGKEEVGGVEKQKTEKVSWLQNIFERVKKWCPLACNSDQSEGK